MHFLDLSLPTLADVNPSRGVETQSRVTEVYQVSVVTGRGARIDLLG